MINYEERTHPDMLGTGVNRIDNPISELVDDNNAGKIYSGPKREYKAEPPQETSKPQKKNIRMAKPSQLE